MGNAKASVGVKADKRSDLAVSRYITGKFAEHLGANVYNGMCAEILRNPTFADFPFGGGGHPDGGSRPESDEKKIAEIILGGHDRMGLPDVEKMLESRQDGLAHWWLREGGREDIFVCSDAGPHGDRAQRVRVGGSGQGISQWCYLPLHRCRAYEWRTVVRSPGLETLSIKLLARDGKEPCAAAEVTGISRKWQTFTGTFELDGSVPAESAYRLVIAANSPGQFVIDRMLLWPADHVGGSDRDVIRLLKESKLPLLRWPGGNFVSGYHWEGGVGPVDERPTLPNPAWGGLEPNLFGTDEFIEFCGAVGCEPMICINAGNGTPEEAARWVEYCNGPADTPEGGRRAGNGHPEPYNVRFWEIGNELYGKWQVGWTDPAGYVDRYREFIEVMQAADPDIYVMANGSHPLDEWDEQVVTELGPSMRTITDHPLLGGSVPSSTDPLDVYRDFMAVPVIYLDAYGTLRDKMVEAGISDPRLAVTELQLFARIRQDETEAETRLTRDNLVNPSTLAEALYDVLLYHTCIRLAPFVELVTHSATVNHGGGLRKERERVYPNPCHHAQAMFSAFAGATPVEVNIECDEEEAPGVLDCTPSGTKYAVIDALAAVGRNGELLLSIVNRGTSGPVDVSVDLEGFESKGPAEVLTLSAELPWAANTLESPDAVRPVEGSADVSGSGFVLSVPAYSVVRVRING